MARLSSFDLLEPPDGVIWTRDDFQLPDEGILKLKYVSKLESRTMPGIRSMQGILK